MAKVREIITISGWKDGSGYSYTTDYSDQVIDVKDEWLQGGAEMDWSWWEPDEPTEGEDLEITVKYYAPDADYATATPIAEYSIWESELRNA